jgi:putative transposase
LTREDGRPVSAHTVRHRRRRYQKLGILGMVDGRHAAQHSEFGQVDPHVADVLREMIAQATDTSTRTVSYYFTKVAREVEGSAAAMPSRATFYRLFARLEGGRHTTGSARTRRSPANRPQEMFEQAAYARPGELMEIDSTPFDVMVRLDDGVAARVELTGLVDLATRGIPAAVLRPTTKSVDAALLLARAVTPAVMRPGRPEALRMEYSALPYQRMLSIDERLEHAAAVPPIIPESIVIDGGSAFASRNFLTACDVFGTEVIHAPPRGRRARPPAPPR